MMDELELGPQRVPRLGLLRPLVALAFVVCCSAVLGSQWTRDRRVTLTPDDAARVLATSPDCAAREQALAACARRVRELLMVIIEERDRGGELSRYADGYLAAIERMAAKPATLVKEKK